MTRTDWQHIAEERLLAAETLLAAKLWGSAYYLAGYAVESGLKSCILVRIVSEPEILFQDGGNKFSVNCWTHDIEKLLELAGLDAVRNVEIQTNAVLGANWKLVSQWREQSRYQMKKQNDAEELYKAITDKPDGVMQWIRPRW